MGDFLVAFPTATPGQARHLLPARQSRSMPPPAPSPSLATTAAEAALQPGHILPPPARPNCPQPPTVVSTLYREFDRLRLWLVRARPSPACGCPRPSRAALSGLACAGRHFSTQTGSRSPPSCRQRRRRQWRPRGRAASGGGAWTMVVFQVVFCELSNVNLEGGEMERRSIVC